MVVGETSDHISVGKMFVLALTKRALRSVNLLSQDEASDACLSSDQLLACADQNRLPLGLVFGLALPPWTRWLVLRQHTMRAVISTAILSADLALGSGLFWVMCLLSDLFIQPDLGMRYFESILSGAAMLFGRTAVLCLALALLCQPLRRTPPILEMME